MNNSANHVKVIPKDVLTLHCIGRGKTIPSLSPFVLKLETFLRMADLNYEIDTKKPFAKNTGKTPWITINGSDISDSQVIIEHLKKKFELDLWGGVSPEEKAMANLTRVAMEEHFNWGLVHWRWVKGINTLPDVMEFPALKMKLVKFVMPRKIKKALFIQGIGRQPYDKMVEMVANDLRSLSQVLGQKSFYLGEDPTEIDCTLFGFLGQVMWSMPHSPYEALLKEELSNLREYCERMRDKFWPDFEELLWKQSSEKK